MRLLLAFGPTLLLMAVVSVAILLLYSVAAVAAVVALACGY